MPPLAPPSDLDHVPAPPGPPLTTTEKESLRRSLRHCDPSVFAAACVYRRTGDTTAAAAVVRGIVEHHTPSDRQLLLLASPSDLRLQEDLGLDSLALLEIFSVTEDALGFNLDADGLRSLRTLGDMLASIGRLSRAQSNLGQRA